MRARRAERCGAVQDINTPDAQEPGAAAQGFLRCYFCLQEAGDEESIHPSLPPRALLAAGRAQGQRLEAGHVLPLALSFLLAHCCCCKEMQAGERSCLRVMGRAVGRSIGAQGTCLEHGLI